MDKRNDSTVPASFSFTSVASAPKRPSQAPAGEFFTFTSVAKPVRK